MNIEERKELRQKLLEELYDIYFKNNGSGESFEDKFKLKEEDKEKYLAYEYLIGRRLVDKSCPYGSTVIYTISIYGIDFIESNHKLTEEETHNDENLSKLNTNLNKLNTNIGQLDQNLVNLVSVIDNLKR